MAERIIELRISYNEAQAGRAFPRFAGDGPEPPIEPVHFLVQYFEQVIRDAISADLDLTGCVVDVLTVDHRTPPKQHPSSTDPNADYF
jgi:hypothetical protein